MTTRFPDNFLWGAATSSHQVEGGNDNDWTAWEAEPGHIIDGSRSGDAAGWWAGRAEEDLALAASLGHNAHRLSLEWSRLEPRPGEWDETAFARYAEILEAAHAAGLKTMVTLHHFTLPRWVAARGGWSWDGVVERFLAFARRALLTLGAHVDLWATINEPAVLAFLAYGGHRWPPGHDELADAFLALRMMMRSHGEAVDLMHRLAPCQVGIVFNMPLFEPARRYHPLDQAVARMQDWSFNGALLYTLETGQLRPPLGRSAVRYLAGAADFIGLNYYGRYAVRFDPRAPTLGRNVQSPTIATEHNDWGEPCPRGLTEQLVRLSRLGVPLYVTENGIYDNDDVMRPGYLTTHVEAVADAIARGADVRGYFHWSLVDNFEWAEGWSTRFGLIGIDRETGERTVRHSARVYEQICRGEL